METVMRRPAPFCVRFSGTDQVAQLDRFIRYVTPAFAAP
jgi:hypothetical protein